MLLIAIDVGRSAVKCAWLDSSGQVQCFEMSSVVSTQFNAFSDPNSDLVNVFADQDISQMEVIGTQGGWTESLSSFFLFGKQALRQGSHVVAFSEGSQYHKFGVAALLYCIARVMASLPSTAQGGDVSLGINLTFNNKEAKSFYSQCLRGFHKIMVGASDRGRLVQREVSFSVATLLVFTQGYCAIFGFIKDLDSPVHKGKGLVIDIGRFTVDLSLVDDLTLVAGQSFDQGTTGLLERLRSLVSKSVNISMEDLEACLKDHTKSFRPLIGPAVVPYDELVSSGYLASYYKELKLMILNFVGDKSIDYVLAVGGGSILVADMLRADFSSKFLEADPVRANVLGMLSLLSI